MSWWLTWILLLHLQTFLLPTSALLRTFMMAWILGDVDINEFWKTHSIVISMIWLFCMLFFVLVVAMNALIGSFQSVSMSCELDNSILITRQCPTVLAKNMELFSTYKRLQWFLIFHVCSVRDGGRWRKSIDEYCCSRSTFECRWWVRCSVKEFVKGDKKWFKSK